MSKPFEFTAGPSPARLMIVGEAWGEKEATYLPLPQPFVGESGKELFRMLFDAWAMPEPEILERMKDYGSHWVSLRTRWLQRESVLLSNVLALRPPGNNLDSLCVDRATAGPEYGLPSLSQGKYLRADLLCQLERLGAEIRERKPNLILALGNTACWALLRSTKISTIRGYITDCVLVPGVKVLPTFHPAAVLRNWSLRTIVLADLMKARLEMGFAHIDAPERHFVIYPSLGEITQWVNQTLANPPPFLTNDIETANGQITEIGFARSQSEALVVPFWVGCKSYWETVEDECSARYQCQRLLASPIPKVGQNYLYDLQYLLREGFRPKAMGGDTMLLHHSLYPEFQKGLGFLGSIYTNSPEWKTLNRHDTTKRDE